MLQRPRDFAKPLLRCPLLLGVIPLQLTVEGLLRATKVGRRAAIVLAASNSEPELLGFCMRFFSQSLENPQINLNRRLNLF